MSKRNLVIVRAGDSSLHEGWLGPVGSPRSWDLVVSYFGNDPTRYLRPDVLRIDGKGSKWKGLHALLTGGLLNWQAYDRIWLPDDDLACTPEAVSAMFQWAEYFDLSLSQPSLSHDSYVSHADTVHHPGFVLRRTNFVELMAPLVTRGLLTRLLPTLCENESGWGLDYLWSQFVDRPREDMGVVDAVQIRHTRPVGGPNYTKLREQGLSPHQELAELRRKYGLHDIAHLCWSAVSSKGEDLNMADPDHALALLQALLAVERRWLNPKLREEEGVVAAHLRAFPALREALADSPAQRASA